jgi:hypothetical protein
MKMNEEWRYSLALGGGEWSVPGGWAVPRVSVDAVEKRNISCSCQGSNFSIRDVHKLNVFKNMFVVCPGDTNYNHCP